jgi:2-keto-3-deoxy-L-rhamnonate aldolase RhmA
MDEKDPEESPVQYTEIAELNGTDFGKVLVQAAELAGTIKLLENEYQGYKDQLRTYLEQAAISTAKAGKHRALLTKGATVRRLDVDKLLKLGVQSSVIEASYVTTTNKPSLRILTEEA